MSIYHPEWVNGRRLWMGSEMHDLIHRLHFGDPTIGWEGDERLAVYWDAIERRWFLERLEDDGVYRVVCKSPVDGVFDERILWDLCQWDRQRRKESIHDEIMRQNERVENERMGKHIEYLNEEAVPRLAAAMKKDGGW